jgi:hypothetical protein
MLFQDSDKIRDQRANVSFFKILDLDSFMIELSRTALLVLTVILQSILQGVLVISS